MNRIRGHFSSILRKHGEIWVPTTLTNQRKRVGQVRELAKRAELIRELAVNPIARKIDGVVRRWANVKSNGPDG